MSVSAMASTMMPKIPSMIAFMTVPMIVLMISVYDSAYQSVYDKVHIVHDSAALYNSVVSIIAI